TRKNGVEAPIPGSRKSYFPETEEKVKHLKRKNAELAVIAKRLEERARKLQEANLKRLLCNTGKPVWTCLKACARQHAKELSQQARALLAKDKQIEALQQEYRVLQVKLTAGKEGPHCLNLIDFDHLLRESQKEVLRLQRQIALKNFKESLSSSKTESKNSSSVAAKCLGPSVPTLETSVNDSSLSKGLQLGEPPLAVEEFELRKKRKKCESLEHEVRKKHKRCKELVEYENEDLKQQVVLITQERDSALRKSQGLQSKLENLEAVLKHMRDVAERRQQLEVEHEEAQLALQEKQEEVRWLRQVRSERENSLDCMQARVRELEDQCRSHIEQFSLLSQELGRFQLQRGRTDPLTSTLVTSDLPLVPCCSSPPPPRGGWEKGNGCRKLVVSGAAATSPTQVKRPESQSNSSKSESVQNSSKSCPTPEVDTASEMEELDVDNIPLMPAPESQGPAKLQVFLARYSYNPFDGPNETPEAELPLTAGEYIYVYGDMDEDGFFEGELMDGRRGLVPSNFVERVSDDDLMTFLLPEGNDLSQSSYHERSSAGASTGSREKSNHSGEEASVSPSSSRLDEEEPVNHTAVPYPRKPTLLKQLSSSIIIGWEPPLLPAGCTDVQSYNVYVDAELRQNVRSGAQTQAAIEELDVARKAYRVSVQSVTEKGSSDKLRCTLCVGKDVCSAPTLLNVRNLAATSAELTWLPSNSSYAHAVYLNEEERDTAKPGVYWHSLRDLHPGTQYVAKVVARLPDGLWELPQEQKPAVIHFTTPLAGTPEAPLDVQAEPGPSAGILLISWLPVTIDAEGSSNGVRVTGYAVYADGQKVMEVTSPTAGSVLVEVSQLQVFQVCREVSVRTMSLYGESVDSVPAQIPSALRKASRHSSQTQAALSSKPLRGSLPKRAPVTHCAAPLFPPQNYSADNSDAKCMVRTPPQHDSSEEKVSEAGKRQLNLLAEHSRGSDLSDILEEEEEEEEELSLLVNLSFLFLSLLVPFVPRLGAGLQLDACDTDSDEDVLERISELPRPKNCSKTLFSIPEVTEEEEEEEEHAVTSESQDGVCQAFPGSDGDDTYRTRLAQAPWTGRTHRESSEDSAQVKPACLELSRAQKTGSRDSRIKPKPGGNSHNRALDPPEGSGRKRRDGAEHCTRLAGGGSHRAHGLPEELREPSSGSETWGRAEPGTIGKTHRDLTPSGLPEAAALTSHCFDARGLEISLEYDSEEEPDGGILHSNALLLVAWVRVELGPREWPLVTLQWLLLQVSGNEDLRFQELPGSPAWQTPTRKGRRSRVLKSSSSSSGERVHGAGRGLESDQSGWRRYTWAVVLANVISLSAGPARSPAAEALVKDDPARVFVALFDYDPSSMSPNPDAAEEELPFKEGQILKVCGDKDADGFYRGECAGRAGYIPCNMVSEVRVESEEAREELLKQGFMPAAPPVESVGTVPPSRLWLGFRRSWRDLGADPVIPRAMVAVFDYNPRESSPNVDVEAELPFSAGDVITVFGSMDDDGFYYGELNRQRGLVPSNFLEAVSPDGGVTEGLHWREDIAGAVGAGNQVMWLGR
uniref:TSPO associated protein 1 n=1 Tax=Pelusios castaneus TaxID=367368 RepID=A0A8C8VFQ2_9SAUR